MILARLLSPDAFGIIATLTMITSFADMFTDAGFQKYIVQNQFPSEKEQSKYISVAFWSNLFISLFLYSIIFLFSNNIAILAGIDGYGNVIRIYSIIILFTSFSSIQFAVYRKKFQYKKLGIIRIIVKFIPLIVTIPLTVYTRSFWALVIGNIAGEATTALALMILSDQRIHRYFSIDYLKRMFVFCGGSMLETLSSWLVSNVSVFIIGQYWGSYYLGLYKTAIITVNQVISIITAATMNVLFSTLSSEQNDVVAFNDTVSQFQRTIGFFSIPLGMGMFVFRDFITLILLGPQWIEASLLIGLWGFVMCESIIFADIGAYAVVAKGKPIYVFFSNSIQSFLLSIILFILRHNSFEVIVIASFIIRWQLTFTHYGFAIKKAGIKVRELPKSISYYMIAAFVMGVFGIIIQHSLSTSIISNSCEIIACIVVYFFVLFLFPYTREELKKLIDRIKDKFLL